MIDQDLFKTIFTVIIGFCIMSLIVLVCYWFSKPARLLDKVTEPTHIINSYEEFQEIYNTILDICNKIEILEKSNAEADGFSKEERLLNLQNNLSRWVQEYNAKSRMLTRNKWKNPNLPYQLKISELCEN